MNIVKVTDGFKVMRESGAEILKITPRDANDVPLGAVIWVDGTEVTRTVLDAIEKIEQERAG